MLLANRPTKPPPLIAPGDIRAPGGEESISNAATVGCHVGHACSMGALDLMQNLGMAAILLNQCGMVVRVNRAAEQLLCPALNIQRGSLCVLDRAASDRFEAALRLISNPSSGVRLLGPLAIPRAEQRPLAVRLAKMQRQDANALTSDSIILLIADPEVKRRPRMDATADMFGLSPAEARLASLLADGATLASAANRLKIVPETARTQLKSIFFKTGTNRQAELVALLIRSIEVI